MKKIIKYLFIFSISLFGLFYSNLNQKSTVFASANSIDEEVLSVFSDNENFSSLLSDNSELATSFNVLDYVNLELYDQNPYGTCYATSLAQMINLSYEYKTNEHIKISASALALQLKDLFFSQGSYALEIIESTANLDYVSEFDFPYELAREYYFKLMSTNDVLDFDFNDKEIIDVKEYYVFPYYTQYISDTVKSQYIDIIKKALVRDGALGVGIEYKIAYTGSHYVYDRTNSEEGCHAMTIIGYDDTFSKDNFVTSASSDGAFIILNSWGTIQEKIYMSYEDFIYLHFIYGVGGFVEHDERAEKISNVEDVKYEIVDQFETEMLSSELEIGYQVSNTTSNSYLTQIELQPLYNTVTAYNLYFDSTDIEIYLNDSSHDLNLATTFIGSFDISAGVNKIVLNQPILVGSEFALKIVIVDEEYTYGYFDKASQKFNALYYHEDKWQTIAYSDNNYNLVKTPFYVNAIISENSEFEISKEDNYQTATTETVTYSLSSNSEISDVGIEIFKHDSVDLTYSSFSVSNINVEDLFDISVTTTNISITAKNFVFGTFKVIVNINNGEKTFIKFLCFDDGILLTTMELDPINLSSKSGYYLRLYSTSLSVDEINVTIPSFYRINNTIDDETKFDLESIFLFNSTNISIAENYSIDTSGRIAKAIIVFSNTEYQTSRTLTFNFNYQTKSQIVYVTRIPNATHSNVEFIETGATVTLNNAIAPNYNFLGWYTTESYTKSLSSFISNYDGQVIYLYAKFELIEVDCFVKKITYDESASILNLSLDFSDYNIGIYDVIEFSSIEYTFNTTSTAVDFSILKTQTYSYQIYVLSSSKATVNNISFDVKIKRHAYRNYEESFNYTYLTQSISVYDKLAINVNANESGTVYNNVSNQIISNGNVYVVYGGYLYLRFEPNENALIDSVTVDGNFMGVPTTYNFNNVTENHIIAIQFKEIYYEIYAVVNGEGSLDKGNTEVVSAGSSITYNFEPSVGSYLSSILIDGVPFSTELTSYTFSNVQKNHEIVITFEKYTFIINSTVVGEGSIGNPIQNIVEYGESATYTFESNDGFTLKQIIVDGIEIDLIDEYTFENVTENHTLYVLFEKDFIWVDISVEGGGVVEIYNIQTNELMESVSGKSLFEYQYNAGLKFINNPNEGYEISAILINGSNVSLSSEITKNNIINDIEIKVYFKLKTFNIMLFITGSGISNQPASQTVNYGDSKTFEFTPSKGYKISSIIINNVKQTITSELVLENITESKNISVVFEILKFNIEWINFNGRVITTSLVDYGLMPVMTFIEPSRDNVGIYQFKFIGWNSEIDGSGHGLEFAKNDETYYAQFEQKLIEFEIKSTAGNNGTILYGESSLVSYGYDKTFTIIPNQGYHIYRIYVDGKIVDNSETYTFENVQSEHTISATFKRNDFKAIISNNQEKGNIKGGIWFERGERAVYNVEPVEGYEIDRIIVNGENVSFSNNSFVIENVNSPLNIVVEYKQVKSNSEIFKNAKHMIISSVVVIAVLTVISSVLIVKKIKKRKMIEEFDD